MNGAKGRVKDMVQKLNSSYSNENLLRRRFKSENDINAAGNALKTSRRLYNSKKLEKENKNVVNKEEEEKEGSLTVWEKAVGVEQLYLLLGSEHSALQQTHRELQDKYANELKKRLSAEQDVKRSSLLREKYEKSAHQMERLQKRESDLLSEILDLREQNELLEFRLHELEHQNGERAIHHQNHEIDTTQNVEKFLERDDNISDSGVISLSPCEEFYGEYESQDPKIDENNAPEISLQEKLSKVRDRVEDPMDKNTLTKAAELLKKYEMKITSLEATLTHMCQERIERDELEELDLYLEEDKCREKSRMIATVSPFYKRQTCLERSGKSSPKKLAHEFADCLNESGIFEEFGTPEHKSKYVQTEPTLTSPVYELHTPDLAVELDKLSRIKEQLEKGTGAQQFNAEENQRDYAFYKEQYEQLMDKLRIYEAGEDRRTKLLRTRLEEEIRLKAEIKYLTGKIQMLQKQAQSLEEEKCEFEEAENDARLRCQQLEVKLNALMEKKNDLQFQLQQNSRTISNLRSHTNELEKKYNECYEYSCRMEEMANKYEERNFELEERELESRCQLQALQSTIPAIVLWNIYVFYRSYNKNVLNFDESAVFNSLQNSIVPIHSNYKNSISVGVNTVDMYNSADTLEHPKITENVYEETLQQADEMIASMEADYNRKLEELQIVLNEKTWKLEECEKRIRNITLEREKESNLLDRVQSLDSEIMCLKAALKGKDEEKQTWLMKEKSLIEEIENLNSDINEHKTIKETLHKKLADQQTAIRKLNEELKFKQDEVKEIEMISSIEIKRLQNQIKKLIRENENQEVNNGELREEVDTLENLVLELRSCVNDEKMKVEKLKVELAKDLANKDEEIKKLRRKSQEIMALDAATEIESSEDYLHSKHLWHTRSGAPRSLPFNLQPYPDVVSEANARVNTKSVVFSEAEVQRTENRSLTNSDSLPQMVRNDYCDTRSENKKPSSQSCTNKNTSPFPTSAKRNSVISSWFRQFGSNNSFGSVY